MRRSMMIGMAVLFGAGCNPKDNGKLAAFNPGPTPAEYREGEGFYNANCAACHGPKGTGTQTGPPLVHIIYEPNHHSDAAFRRAAELGVVPHHWSFGPMPPVAGVTDADMDRIIGYVRWLQRQGGIY